MNETKQAATGATDRQIEAAKIMRAALQAASISNPAQSWSDIGENQQRRHVAAIQALEGAGHAIVPTELLPLLRQLRYEALCIDLGTILDEPGKVVCTLNEPLWRDLMAVLDGIEGER
jgi:hypothetical protein